VVIFFEVMAGGLKMRLKIIYAPKIGKKKP
jgi:hypothetical protein